MRKTDLIQRLRRAGAIAVTLVTVSSMCACGQNTAMTDEAQANPALSADDKPAGIVPDTSEGDKTMTDSNSGKTPDMGFAAGKATDTDRETPEAGTVPSGISSAPDHTIEEKCPISYYTRRSDVKYPTPKHVTYHSDTCGTDRGVNILLPADYSPDRQYPVFYVLHGIFGDENSFTSDTGNKISEIVTNMAADGRIPAPIIVFPNMYASSVPGQQPGFTAEACEPYDNFVNDLVNDLMPYMAANYSVLTDREHTWLAGFSMGGRETLYITLCHPELFGYVCAISPAPGMTPAVDMFMSHPGTLTEDQVRFADDAVLPDVLMICCGTKDSVVGRFPLGYHELYEKNGISHLWYEITGADHDNNAIRSGIYNLTKQIAAGPVTEEYCTYYEDGSVRYSNVTEYHGNRQHITCTYYTADGQVITSQEYDYVDPDRLIREIIRDDTGSVLCRTEYTYDAGGRLLDRTLYQPDGCISTLDTFSYDDTGDLTGSSRSCNVYTGIRDGSGLKKGGIEAVLRAELDPAGDPVRIVSASAYGVEEDYANGPINRAAAAPVSVMADRPDCFNGIDTDEIIGRFAGDLQGKTRGIIYTRMTCTDGELYGMTCEITDSADSCEPESNVLSITCLADGSGLRFTIVSSLTVATQGSMYNRYRIYDSSDDLIFSYSAAGEETLAVDYRTADGQYEVRRSYEYFTFEKWVPCVEIFCGGDLAMFEQMEYFG